MSLPEAQDAKRVLHRRKVLVGLGSALLVAPVLSACGGGGFQPLYGATASGGTVRDALAAVDIATIPGRVGQRVRNELIFQATGGGGGSNAPTTYRLDIAMREYVQSILVAQTGVASGQVYAIDATFKVVRITDNKVVMQGNSYARAPYETNQVSDPLTQAPSSDGRSIFSNIRARRDAEDRAAVSLAGDIRTRVAVFLSRAT
jgi:LPS-assembly lipoprotein